jgi:hypothetical protein
MPSSIPTTLGNGYYCKNCHRKISELENVEDIFNYVNWDDIPYVRRINRRNGGKNVRPKSY